MRLDKDASCLFPFFYFFFRQRCTCWRMPDCSDQQHRQSCDSQTPQCPRPRLTASFRWLAITSARLFLLLSYDVLWPCSGSRTVTVLSPAPSDRHTVGCHMCALCPAPACAQRGRPRRQPCAAAAAGGESASPVRFTVAWLSFLRVKNRPKKLHQSATS